MSSVDMRLSRSLPSMSGSLRSMIMQSKTDVRSRSSASCARPTAVISMSSSPIRRAMLSRCTSSSSTSSTRLTFWVNLASRRANTSLSSSRVVGLTT
ncbi:hypothetical protein D3C76_896710 [compost metagenome]